MRKKWKPPNCLKQCPFLLSVDNGTKIGEINDKHLDEASGLCASRVHRDILYAHNDHGGDNKLYAINSKTAHVSTVINNLIFFSALTPRLCPVKTRFFAFLERNKIQLH